MKMSWILSSCNDLRGLVSQIQSLEKASVIHFDFSVTIILSVCFMVLFRLIFRKQSLWQCLLWTSFFFYVLNVIRLVFFPIPINGDYIEILKRETDCGILIERRHNLQLFDFMKWGNLFHITTIGNFLLLLPFSFYFPILFRKYHWNILNIAFVGFAISLSIESTQLLYDLITGYAYRGFNVDDLMMNTLGVLVGYLIYSVFKLFLWILRRIKRLFVFSS